MDSSPIVCITGQVGSKLIGSDGFQETDITGVTLPVTKHNYLITRAQDLAPAVREAFQIASSGRPGPVLIDITKDAQQTSCEFDWDAATPRPHARPERVLDQAALSAALEMINSAKRPMILAGHGIILSGATDIVRFFAERAQIPISMTLLGIGGIPASHPLNLGMPRMRAEGVHARLARARSGRTGRGPRATPLPPTARQPPARWSARSRLWGTPSQRAATVSACGTRKPFLAAGSEDPALQSRRH